LANVLANFVNSLGEFFNLSVALGRAAAAAAATVVQVVILTDAFLPGKLHSSSSKQGATTLSITTLSLTVFSIMC
jgi:hypothetical protein